MKSHNPCKPAQSMAVCKVKVSHMEPNKLIVVVTEMSLHWTKITLIFCTHFSTMNLFLNPLKCSGVRQLHLKVFSAIQV